MKKNITLAILTFFIVSSLFFLLGCQKDLQNEPLPNSQSLQVKASINSAKVAANANDRFVSTTGNDNNTGTFSQPWKTIQKAANSVPSGGTVYIMGGTYYERISINVSGTASAYTVFKNYDSNPVMIDGNNTAGVLMKINGASYVEIRGLTFQNCLGSFSAGIQITSNVNSTPSASHHINIIGNTIKQLYASSSTTTYAPNIYANGIQVSCSDPNRSVNNILLDNNQIFNCRTGWTEAIGITGNVENFTVSNNIVHDTGNIGIDASGRWGTSSNPATDFARNGIIRKNTVYNCRSLVEGGAGIYLDGSSNILVEQNIVHDNVNGIQVGCERPNNTVGNHTIRNNISYHNDTYGIGVVGWSAENRVITGCKIINNTIFGNMQVANSNLGELTIFNSVNTNVFNNIICNTVQGAKLLVVSDGATNLQMWFNNYHSTAWTHNYTYLGTTYYNFINYRNGSGKDGNSTTVDPLFVNASINNFNLQAASPCKNVCDPNYYPAATEKDIAGNNRRVGYSVDKGAYEYQ
jgi:hypothetical protein